MKFQLLLSVLEAQGERYLPLALLALSFAASAQPATEDAAVLEVSIQGVRNAQGQVGCQIFKSGKGFPNSSDQAVAGFYVPINSGQAQCRFTGLTPGSYAVTVMHDENNNRKLDTNLLGIPKEGYGVSNNTTYAMSQPKWDESKFDLNTGEKKSITINIRY